METRCSYSVRLKYETDSIAKEQFRRFTNRYGGAGFSKGDTEDQLGNYRVLDTLIKSDVPLSLEKLREDFPHITFFYLKLTSSPLLGAA